MSVCRPGRFGNPFRTEDLLTEARAKLELMGLPDQEQIQLAAQQLAVNRFARGMQNPDDPSIPVAMRPRFIWMQTHLYLLRNKNLACFCPLLTKSGKPNPCHADVLLNLLNQLEPDESKST